MIAIKLNDINNSIINLKNIRIIGFDGKNNEDNEYCLEIIYEPQGKAYFPYQHFYYHDQNDLLNDYNNIWDILKSK